MTKAKYTWSDAAAKEDLGVPGGDPGGHHREWSALHRKGERPGDKCRGKRVFKVLRYCCAGGNCFDCFAKWNRANRKVVEQFRTVDEEKAQQVARNWRTYEAWVEEVV